MPHELAAIGIADYHQIVSRVNRIIYRVIADGRRDLQSLLERRLLIG